MALPWSDYVGTVKAFFRIGIAGPRLKDSSGNLVVRNPGDSADAAITASQVNVSGNSVVLNSDAAGSGADWTLTLSRPSSGMTSAVTLTLPVDDGTANQVLATDGNGALSWASAGSTAACLTVDTTTVNFNSSSPVTAFTLPANAVVDRVNVIVDTAFANGTPSMSVGISGSTSKYMGTTDNDLTQAAETRFETHPGKAASGSTEAIIVTLSPGTTDAGSCRVEVVYAVPA